MALEVKVTLAMAFAQLDLYKKPRQLDHSIRLVEQIQVYRWVTTSRINVGTISYSLNFKVALWKMMVGRLVSFWEGNFLGASC